MVKHTSGTRDPKRRNEFNLAHVEVFLGYIFKEGQFFIFLNFFFSLMGWEGSWEAKLRGFLDTRKDVESEEAHKLFGVSA